MFTQRTRTSDERMGAVPATVKTYRGGPPSYLASTSTLSSGNLIGQISTMSDCVTPRFNKRRGKEILLNEMLLSKVRTEPVIISHTAGPYPSWYNGGWELYEGDFGEMLRLAFQSWPVFNFDTGKMRSIALTKAYAKVNASATLGGELVKDLDTSIMMFRRPFNSAWKHIGKMNRRYARYVKRKSAEPAKVARDVWLETRYGWRPIMFDIESVGNGVIDMVEKFSKHGVLRVARASERGGNTSTAPVDVYPYTGLRFTGVAQAAYSVSVDAGVIYEEKPQTTQEQLRKLMGGRLSDLPATLWAIIPYSFVVDWFVNIETWLQAVTPNPYVEIKGNWVTQVIRREERFNAGLITSSWSGVTKTSFYPSSCKYTDEVTRLVNQPLPTLPAVKGEFLSTAQAVDAMALSLSSILKGLMKFKHR